MAAARKQELSIPPYVAARLGQMAVEPSFITSSRGAMN